MQVDWQVTVNIWQRTFSYQQHCGISMVTIIIWDVNNSLCTFRGWKLKLSTLPALQNPGHKSLQSYVRRRVRCVVYISMATFDGQNFCGKGYSKHIYSKTFAMHGNSKLLIFL